MLLFYIFWRSLTRFLISPTTSLMRYSFMKVLSESSYYNTHSIPGMLWNFMLSSLTIFDLYVLDPSDYLFFGFALILWDTSLRYIYCFKSLPNFPEWEVSSSLFTYRESSIVVNFLTSRPYFYFVQNGRSTSLFNFLYSLPWSSSLA